jgi:hypothetical protein
LVANFITLMPVEAFLKSMEVASPPICQLLIANQQYECSVSLMFFYVLAVITFDIPIVIR